MSRIKHTEIQTLQEALNWPQTAGYVLNFSDRTIGLFFDEEFNIDIHSGKYQAHGGSKFKKLLGLLETENGQLGAKVLRALWEHREALVENAGKVDPSNLPTRYFAIVQRLEGSEDIINTDGLDNFTDSETLDELISSIQRDINAKRPQVGLDRLHTYCMKKFAHLLSTKGASLMGEAPLHARAGLYIKVLENKGQLHGMSLKIMKASLAVFEDFNHVRNNKTFAHDNELLGAAEARYIFESICNLLRLIRTIEAAKFGA